MKVINVRFFQNDADGNLFTKFGTDLDTMGGVLPNVGDLIRWFEPGLVAEIRRRYLDTCIGEISYIAIVVNVREPTDAEKCLVDCYKTTDQ